MMMMMCVCDAKDRTCTPTYSTSTEVVGVYVRYGSDL